MSSSGLLHPAAAIAVLLALAGQSTLMFGIAVARLRRGITPALDERTALVETVAGAAGLLVVAYATPISLRVTPTFWIETYTVISAVAIAAAHQARDRGRCRGGVLDRRIPDRRLCRSTRRNAAVVCRACNRLDQRNLLPSLFRNWCDWFALLRSIVEQTDALRRLLGRLSEERARVSAAKHAYDIGHDIPKALLREVRRGR